MAENSGISWCDATFNPWLGCSKVSPACKHCYAEREQDNRHGRVKWGPSGTRSVTSLDNWKKPIKWDKQAAASGKRLRVFCASLADIFEDWQGPMVDHNGNELFKCYCGSLRYLDGSCGGCGKLPHGGPVTMRDVRQQLFNLIDATPHLDWLLLTKRPENIKSMIELIRLDGGTTGRIVGLDIDTPAHRYFRRNVWLGCSVENQEYADKRIPELLKCRDMSPVLFLSCEPLLGPVDLRPALWFEDQYFSFRETSYFRPNFWVIAGGESGPEARPSHPNWFRSLRDQCSAANVPFHFKQLSQCDGKNFNNYDTFPTDLQVREFPNVQS